MKNLYSLLTGGALLVACSPVGHDNVSGMLTGIESDTVIVRTTSMVDRNISKLDTVALIDNKFSVALPDSVAAYVSIYAMPSQKVNPDGSVAAMSMQSVSFPLLPKHKVKLSGSLADCKVEGDEFYKDLEDLALQTKPLNLKIEAIMKKCSEMQAAGIERDSIRQVYSSAEAIYDSIQIKRADYVKAHPDRLVSVYILSMLSPAQGGELLSLLPETAKTGELGFLYERISKDYQKSLEFEKNKESIKPGSPAPDFTLPMLDGKPFSLSQLKGKYVVIDFWGSWCGWCIKGIPEMKKTYDKYKGKLEIVGVDCGDTEEKWKAAVDQYKIPWINVRNSEDNDITTKYAISGYPTKIIVGPDGNIIKVVVGEDPEFYSFIDSEMKKK